MSFGIDDAAMAGIGMAMQLAGSFAQKRQQDDIRNRTIARQNQEGETQMSIARQNAARVAQTAQEVGANQTAAKQAADSDALAKEFTPAGAGMTEASYAPANPGAPKEISDTMAQAIGAALAKGKAYAKSKAGISAVGKGGLDQGIAIGRSATDIGLNNNAAQGSWNVMNQDLGAIHPNSTAMALGDAANGIGGLFATAGMRGLAKPKSVLPGGVGTGTNPY